MSFDATFPKDDSYLADFPAGDREQTRAIKEDQIVNAGRLQGLTAGNANGQIPINNGTENVNLNASKLNGKTSADFAPKSHDHNTATTSSNGFMSNVDKQKLDGIATGAETNQNAFTNVKVGESTIQADSKTDTLELAQGSNINLVADTTNDKVTIELTGTVPTADKANKDSAGQTINTTYIKEVTGNNDTLTIKKGDNTSSTVKIDDVGFAQNARIAQLDKNMQEITSYIQRIVYDNANSRIIVLPGNRQKEFIDVQNVKHSKASDSAIKATQDSLSQEIVSTYIKNLFHPTVTQQLRKNYLCCTLGDNSKLDSLESGTFIEIDDVNHAYNADTLKNKSPEDLRIQTNFLASQGGAGHGYTFQNDEAADTGMFSDRDGDLYFMLNGVKKSFSELGGIVGGSLQQNGWVKFNNGLILQWGLSTEKSWGDSDIHVTYPIRFGEFNIVVPNLYSSTWQFNNFGGGADNIVQNNLEKFVFHHGSDVGECALFWIAVGK